MRFIRRLPLPLRAQNYLDRKRKEADAKLRNAAFDTEREWKYARQTRTGKSILGVLQEMSGARQRCMYCLDSHGSDVDHFRPKAAYPRWMFRWTNMVLSCSECGRIKGSQFPMRGRTTLLVDPTKDDPWQHVDFDPATGNLTARFHLQENSYSERGRCTVEVLQLDRREALAEGYRRTWRRLCEAVRVQLGASAMSDGDFAARLVELDDHGLLGWCLDGTGQGEPPFDELRRTQPETWAQCVAAVMGL